MSARDRCCWGSDRVSSISHSPFPASPFQRTARAHPNRLPGSTVAINQHTNELTTTSLAIAEGTGVQHKNVLELIRKYPDQLERFGSLEFKTRVMRGDGRGGQKGQYAILNEPQATLLFSFMRNMPMILEFKVRLVEEFYRMREQLQSQTKAPAQLTRMEILKMAVEAEERAEREEFGTLRFDIQKSGDLSQILACHVIAEETVFLASYPKIFWLAE